LGGNNSLANSVNNRGQVVGSAQNAIPDFSQFGALIGLLLSPQQWRGFVWQAGNMQEIGTLGGADSGGIGDVAINQRGQVGGISFTNDVVNPITQFPTLDTFLWQNGDFEDLGSLGGVFTSAFTMNDVGEITGFSDIAGDIETHAYLWRQGQMRDLGTLGGTFGGGGWLNSKGDVSGASTTAGDEFLRGFVWRNDRMTDLERFPATTAAMRS
jgi:probable HAF family extracellular repeat protein